MQTVDEIENNIARECLRFLRDRAPRSISAPSGTYRPRRGWADRVAFAVGLLNALHAYRGERVSAGQLAEEASHIEIEVLKEPIGKQDQYAAAFGGLNLFRFNPGGGVTVDPQGLSNGALDALFDHIMTFWTGHQRDTRSVLTEQKENTPRKLDSLLIMREQAYRLQALLHNGQCEPEEFGRILDEGWQLKRQLASTISNDSIDTSYRLARQAGAVGGKLCGAGGGGFLLFVVPLQCQDAVRQALSDLNEVPIGTRGTRLSHSVRGVKSMDDHASSPSHHRSKCTALCATPDCGIVSGSRSHRPCQQVSQPGRVVSPRAYLSAAGRLLPHVWPRAVDRDRATPCHVRGLPVCVLRVRDPEATLIRSQRHPGHAVSPWQSPPRHRYRL